MREVQTGVTKASGENQKWPRREPRGQGQAEKGRGAKSRRETEEEQAEKQEACEGCVSGGRWSDLSRRCETEKCLL